jgi:GntR family transcriptional regulator
MVNKSMFQKNREVTDDFGRLNPDSLVPLYHQLKEQILMKIEAQEWVEGDLIPSENDLLRLFGVSRATVRRTIEILVNDGFLLKKRGKGTFVRKSKYEKMLPTLTSYTEDMVGKDATKKVIAAEYIQPSPKIRGILKLREDEKVLYLKRLMIVDKIPLGVLYEYIVGRYNLGLDEDYSQSLYKIFEKYGISPKEADQTIEASISTEEESALMKLNKHFPTLVIKRIVYDARGDLMEYVRGVYHGDRYRYQLKLHRDIL